MSTDDVEGQVKPEVTKEEDQDKEKVKKLRMETLNSRRNKAQIAAATCLSLAHVSLLKALLDKGPEGTKYYIGLLVLVSITLSVEVIVGIISIHMANLKRENMMDEKKLKIVSFWQNIINYLLYGIFIMDAYIIGLEFGPITKSEPGAVALSAEAKLKDKV